MPNSESSITVGRYFTQILNHIKENVGKDIRYICIDCGRLKNRDGELSGTLCPSCDSSNLSLDPVISKFTTMVKNIQFDIENRHDDRGEFLKPAEPCAKSVLSSKHNLTTSPSVKKSKDKPSVTAQSTTLGVQTDISFSPFDQVSFLINKALDCSNERDVKAIPKKLDDGEIEDSWKSSHSNPSYQRQTGETVVQSDKYDPVQISETDENAFDFRESLSNQKEQGNKNVPDANRPENNQTPPEKNTQSNKNDEKILTKAQPVETDTEMIESSVDDYLQPKKSPSSPLLFSQETKDVDMEVPSSGENSDTECVNATPPKEDFSSTCTWRKDVSRCEKVEEEEIPSDQDDEMSAAANKKEKENQDRTHMYSEKELADINFVEANAQDIGAEPMQTDNTLDNTVIETKNTVSNDVCAANEDDVQNGDGKVKLTEQERLTQNSQKFSKHNLKIVVSSIEGTDYDHLERFIALFNPMIENDVNQHSNFLIVGVNSENKVLRRTPKFLKAISLHVCIVNVDYLVSCNEAKDVVSLERKFIPFDSSGSNGPIRSCISPNYSLLGGFVFFSLERDDYLSTLLEFIIIHNGGILVPDIKLFKAYNSSLGETSTNRVNGAKSGTVSQTGSREDGGNTGALDDRGPQYKKVLLYGDNEEAQFTEAYKLKVFAAYSCHSLNYKRLFDCVASYDLAEIGL